MKFEIDDLSSVSKSGWKWSQSQMLKIRYLENDVWKYSILERGKIGQESDVRMSSVKKLTLNVCFFLKLKKKAFYDLLKFVRSAIVRFYFYLYFMSHIGNLFLCCIHQFELTNEHFFWGQFYFGVRISVRGRFWREIIRPLKALQKEESAESSKLVVGTSPLVVKGHLS